MYEANALQAALVTWLGSNTSWDWYDYVPPGTPYDYGEVGEATEVPDDLHDGDGSSHTVTLHLWSAGLGTKAINECLEEIDALHHSTLTVTGATVAEIVREFSQTMKDRDPDTGGELRHGVARYRIDLEES